jgi:hypothetical protein
LRHIHKQRFNFIDCVLLYTFSICTGIFPMKVNKLRFQSFLKYLGLQWLAFKMHALYTFIHSWFQLTFSVKKCNMKNRIKNTSVTEIIKILSCFLLKFLFWHCLRRVHQKSHLESYRICLRLKKPIQWFLKYQIKSFRDVGLQLFYTFELC